MLMTIVPRQKGKNMRLIDADALKDNLLVKGINSVWDLLKNTPTVDAVPVIRCKDCKYWLPHSQFGFDEDNDEYYDYCELLVPDDDYYAITRQAEDFCSKAERGNNEAD